MSVVIKSIQIQYKDEQGEYHGINSVSDKTTADQIAAIEAAGQEAIADVEEAGEEVIESLPNVQEYVDDWLDEHPEATTTVQDGSITEAKFTNAVKAAYKNAYVTPEMYGAVGDGTTDDTNAWQSALNAGGYIICRASANYLVTNVLRVKANTHIQLNGCTIKTSQTHLFFNFLDTDVFTVYNGNGNICIENGKIEGGSVSFWHCENILFDHVNFKNCENDHYFEICACKDFTIRNCSFIGMRTRSGSVHEYINIDPNTTEQSTYFTGRTYPAGNYDGTKNKNVYILNCYFDINRDDLYFQAQDNPFGCHSPMGMYHENIQFIGNTCYNYKYCGLRLADFKGAIIKNNYFYSAIVTDSAVTMTKSEDMDFAIIDCVFENNTIITQKWGVMFYYTKNFICRGNLYENLDLFDHSFGTMLDGNEGLVFVDNIRPKNLSPGELALNQGDYKDAENEPFDLLQTTATSDIAISGADITLRKFNWTSFNEIGFLFNGQYTVHKAERFDAQSFAAGTAYPLVQDPTTGNALITFTIDSTDPSKLTLAFLNGAVSRAVSMVFIGRTHGVKQL